MDSAADIPKGMGFPIRKSPDQRLLTSPRSLSQGATSFIASRYQGIHQMPFFRLRTKDHFLTQAQARRSRKRLQLTTKQPRRTLPKEMVTDRALASS